MTREEIAKLLALDERRERIPNRKDKLGAQCLFEMYGQSRAETAAATRALRRYIEIMEAPDEMKWCAATLREIDAIRALAGLPPKLAGAR